MKIRCWLLAAACCWMLVGCSMLIPSWKAEDGKPSPADLRAANTIGTDFERYVKRDPQGTQADREYAADVVGKWREKGATTETLQTVLPVYKQYVEKDPSLSQREKNLRMMAAEGWEALVGTHYPNSGEGFWGLTTKRTEDGK